MDYKELIEQLRFFSQSTANEHIISCLYANAATAIEVLLAEREAAGWISVEENPPEVGEKCLITDGDVVYRGYVRPDGIWKTGIKPDELWENTSLFPPTHWMPLPTPPARQQTEG